jgi:hypothetical protein
MKKIWTFFFLVMLCAVSTDLTAQDNKDFYADVIRSADETMAQLHWPSAGEKVTYEVVLTNMNTKASTRYTALENTLAVHFLDVPALYQWRVSPQNVEYNTKIFDQYYSFSTTFSGGGIKVSPQLFSVLKGWKGQEYHRTSLESFVRERAQKTVAPTEVESFIQKFYKGNPPSKRGGGDDDDQSSESDCLCELITSYSDANDSGNPGFPVIDTLSCQGCNENDPWGCNHWDRNVEKYAAGIAKDLLLNMSGRLNEGNKESYTMDTLGRTSFVDVEFLCERSACCGTEIDYDIFYQSQLELTGGFKNNGNIHIEGYDITSVFLVHEDNQVEILGAPLALAGYLTDSTTTTTNWEDVLRDAFEIVTSILPDTIFATVDTDTLDIDFEEFQLTIQADTILGNALDIITGIYDIITGNNFIRFTDNQGSHIDEQLWAGTLQLEPNQTKRFLLRSVSQLLYKDVWGKRDVCPAGKFWLDAALNSAYSMAFVMDKGGEDPDPTDDLFCCFDDYAEYYTHSFISPSNATRMLSIAGAAIGRQPSFEDPWVDLQSGEQIPFQTGGLLLNTPQGSLTATNDCCRGDAINLAFNVVEIECVEKGGDGPTTPDDPVLAKAGPGPSGPSYDCSRVKGVIQIEDCPSSNDHTLQIWAYDADNPVPYLVLTLPANLELCFYEFEFDVQPGHVYFVRHSVNNGCLTESANIQIDIPAGGAGGLNTQPQLSKEQVRPFTATQSLHLFPNPSNGQFTLEFSGMIQKGNVQFEVLSMQGQLLKTFTLAADVPSHQLQVDNLAPGIYVGVLKDGLNPPVSTRIVIK